MAQYADLLARATAAGKREELERRYAELVRVLRDPQWAFQVGRPDGQTNQPGGLYRRWQYHFLYVRYAIFPDAKCGWVWHIEFNPPSWA